jgi:hypothetical protein
MAGLSERAYASQSCLSRGAVQKARKTGRLVLFAAGSINAAASVARRLVMTDPDQQLRSRGGLSVGGKVGATGSGIISIIDALSPSHPAQRTSFLNAAQVGATLAGVLFEEYNGSSPSRTVPRSG